MNHRNRIRRVLSDLEWEAWLDALEQVHLRIDDASAPARVWWRAVRARSTEQDNVRQLAAYVGRLSGPAEASIERMFQRAMRLTEARIEGRAPRTPEGRCNACGVSFGAGATSCHVCGTVVPRSQPVEE